MFKAGLRQSSEPNFTISTERKEKKLKRLTDEINLQTTGTRSGYIHEGYDDDYSVNQVTGFVF